MMRIKISKVHHQKQNVKLVVENSFLYVSDHFILRKLAHAIYRDFQVVKKENFQKKYFDIFLSFAQYTLLVEAFLASIHNACFGSKIRKLGIPCKPQFLTHLSRRLTGELIG